MVVDQSSDIEQLKDQHDIDGLIALVNLPDCADPRRRAAVEALSQIGGADAADVLRYALRDPDAGVRAAAARGLGGCGDADVVKELQALADDPDESVRVAAIEGMLHMISRRNPSKPERESSTESDVRKVKIACFLLGAVLWGLVFFGGLGLAIELELGGVFVIVWLVLLLLLAAVAARGWDTRFVDKRGNTDTGYKLVIIIILACTGIGLIPVAYWTGRGVLRLAYGM